MIHYACTNSYYIFILKGRNIMWKFSATLDLWMIKPPGHAVILLEHQSHHVFFLPIMNTFSGIWKCWISLWHWRGRRLSWVSLTREFCHVYYADSYNSCCDPCHNSFTVTAHCINNWPWQTHTKHWQPDTARYTTVSLTVEVGEGDSCHLVFYPKTASQTVLCGPLCNCDASPLVWTLFVHILPQVHQGFDVKGWIYC